MVKLAQSLISPEGHSQAKTALFPGLRPVRLVRVGGNHQAGKNLIAPTGGIKVVIREFLDAFTRDLSGQKAVTNEKRYWMLHAGLS